MEKAAIWLKVIQKTYWEKSAEKGAGFPVRTTSGGATRYPAYGSSKAAPAVERIVERIGKMRGNPNFALHFPVLICDSQFAEVRRTSETAILWV
jgi:hypothetical protein